MSPLWFLIVGVLLMWGLLSGRLGAAAAAWNKARTAGN